MENQLNLFQLGLRGFLKMLRDNRGEVSATPPKEPEGLNPPEGGQPPKEPEGTPPVTPLVKEEKLYAGRFKDPEELEVAYKESSTEGQRLAGEVKRLTQMLQSSLTPGEKKEVEEKVTDLTKHFDTETARVLDGYFKSLVDNRFATNNQATKEESDFNTQVLENWEETKKLFPEVVDPKGKLYIRANEIMFERGLAKMDGKTVVLTTPFAYRMSVEAASVELSRQTPSPGKNKLGAIAGKGGKSAPQGKLTYEQYQALPSDEARDAYDQTQLVK